MAFYAASSPRLIICTYFLALVLPVAHCEDIFLKWHVAFDYRIIRSVYDIQPVITINGKCPGPLINATTDDVIYVNVFNHLDEPLLFTWNGIQQRLNSWQDGVSGTNCAIQPRTNWTYVFQAKDQIGSFSYFPSVNFQKAAGGFGPLRVNNRIVISVPFPKPDAEFDLLIGDWYQRNYMQVRSMMNKDNWAYNVHPDTMLINGKGSYLHPDAKGYASFTVRQGKTYRFRISNVGTAWSFNFRIQNHRMVLVETEGSYTNQITLDSLDVHVGQSYSVLVTADQNQADYYVVASPKMSNASSNSTLVGVAVLHYCNSTTPAIGNLPNGPDPFDLQFSVNQAKSIKWNLTTGAARPNPQGTFNVTNVTLSQTFTLRGSTARIDGAPYYAVNNVSYLTPDTPLKLADYKANGSGVYQLDQFPVNSSNVHPVRGVFVATGIHKGWIELVFKNDLDIIDSWHLDGFGFFVVGFGDGKWTPKACSTYNIHDPVVRSTVQVYPGGWTAVYAYLDNPGMWNLRSQLLKNWYLGQELYLRVYDADPDPAKESPPPQNLLLCGKFQPPTPPSSRPVSPPPLSPPPLSPPPPSKTNGAPLRQLAWFDIFVVFIVTTLYTC